MEDLRFISISISISIAGVTAILAAVVIAAELRGLQRVIASAIQSRALSKENEKGTQGNQ